MVLQGCYRAGGLPKGLDLTEKDPGSYCEGWFRAAPTRRGVSPRRSVRVVREPRSEPCWATDGGFSPRAEHDATGAAADRRLLRIFMRPTAAHGKYRNGSW